MLRRLAVVVLAISTGACASWLASLRCPSSCPPGQGVWRFGDACYCAPLDPSPDPTPVPVCEPEDAPAGPVACGALECPEDWTRHADYWCVPPSDRICGEEDAGCWHYPDGEGWQYIPAPTPTPTPEPTPEPTPAPTPVPQPPAGQCGPVERVGVVFRCLRDKDTGGSCNVDEKRPVVPEGKRWLLAGDASVRKLDGSHVGWDPGCHAWGKPRWEQRHQPDQSVDVGLWSPCEPGSATWCREEGGRGYFARFEFDFAGLVELRARHGDVCSPWMPVVHLGGDEAAHVDECVRIGLTSDPLAYLRARQPHTEPLGDGCRWYENAAGKHLIWDGCACTKTRVGGRP